MCILLYKKSSEPIYGAPRPRYRSGIGFQVNKLHATSSPPQEKVFIWPPFFEYNKRLLRQKTGGACLYMPQDSHWLASFEVIPPPQKS